MKWADKLNLGRIRGRLPKARTAAASVAAGVVLAGCNPVYLVTGEVLKAYSTAHVIPYTLEGSDLDMSCAMSEALCGILSEGLGVPPNRTYIEFAESGSQIHLMRYMYRYM